MILVRFLVTAPYNTKPNDEERRFDFINKLKF